MMKPLRKPHSSPTLGRYRQGTTLRTYKMPEIVRCALLAITSEVRPTAAITCEAHIDEARVVVGHLQLQRFDWFIALLGSTLRFLRVLSNPDGIVAH